MLVHVEKEIISGTNIHILFLTYPPHFSFVRARGKDIHEGEDNRRREVSLSKEDCGPTSVSIFSFTASNLARAEKNKRPADHER